MVNSFLVAQKCCCICEHRYLTHLTTWLGALMCCFALAADHSFRPELLYSSQSILQWIYFISNKLSTLTLCLISSFLCVRLDLRRQVAVLLSNCSVNLSAGNSNNELFPQRKSLKQKRPLWNGTWKKLHFTTVKTGCPRDTTCCTTNMYFAVVLV